LTTKAHFLTTETLSTTENTEEEISRSVPSVVLSGPQCFSGSKSRSPGLTPDSTPSAARFLVLETDSPNPKAGQIGILVIFAIFFHLFAAKSAGE
jgi:hypothetical protein